MNSKTPQATDDGPEYFLLRPAVEKAYGYSHAVRIGHDIKISGAAGRELLLVDAGAEGGDLEKLLHVEAPTTAAGLVNTS